MTTEVLHYCLDIDEYKNFTRVAELHFISQQGLSQQIKNLEKEIGIKIFNRNNKSVTTTKLGELFISQIRPAVTQIDAVIARVKALGEGMTGYLSIGCNGPSPRMNLIEVIEQYSKEYPNVEINVRTSGYSEIFESFENGEFDAILLGDFKGFDTSLYNIRRCKAGVVNAVFSKSHSLATKETVSKEDLQKEQLICLDIEGEEVRKQRMEKFQEICGKVPDKIKFVKDTDTVDLFVESGLGFTLLNSNLSKYYKSSTLKFLQIEGVKAVHPTWLVWRKDSNNLALNYFVDIAKRMKLILEEKPVK